MLGEEFRVVLVTAPDDEVAARLARGLVEAGLAACVNRLSAVRSVYAWQGKIEEDEEVLLIVKTLERLLEPLATWLQAEHPYETPECVALEPTQITRSYARWLSDSCLPGDSLGNP